MCCYRDNTKKKKHLQTVTSSLVVLCYLIKTSNKTILSSPWLTIQSLLLMRAFLITDYLNWMSDVSVFNIHVGHVGVSLRIKLLAQH